MILFDKIKNINFKYLLLPILASLLIIGLYFLIANNINIVSESNKNIFAYTVKVRSSVEKLDKIFERAELNVNVMTDSIANSYDASKQKDKAYNLLFINEMDSLVKSVLANSPNVDGSWFQINATLPFAAHAYNWFALDGNQFVDVKDQFVGTTAMDRKINPDDDPYYYNAITNNGVTWSDIYTDPDTKEAMMTISSPVYKGNTLIGVVGIDISTGNLQQILTDMQLVLGDSELYLIDKKNDVILSQLSSGLKPTKDNYKFLNLFKGGNEGPIEYYDDSDGKIAMVLSLSNNYKFAIVFETSILFYETNQIIILIWGLFILLIILTIVALVNQFKIFKMIELNEITEDETNKEE